MLPWFLRKIAAAVYGEPPNSSIDEALGYAMKVSEVPSKLLRPLFSFSCIICERL